MKGRCLLLVLLPLILLVACDDGARQRLQLEELERMNRADSLVADSPTVALRLLDSCEAKVATWPEDLHMRFRLLQARAQNKAYVPFTSDSIMTIVANYYEKNGNPNERMEAHYLLGCVYRDLGEAPKALSVFHDAVDFADTTDVDCDYALLSRVHAQMADLLEKIQLPYDALIESRHSVRNAYKAKDTLMAISSEAYQSNVYYLIGKLDSVIDIGERVFKSFLRCGDTLYAFYYLNPAISAYLELGNMREAKSLIDIQDDLYYKYYGSGSISKSMNSASINRGEYYRKSNNMDSARYYYSLANPPSSPNNALLLYRELAHYYVKKRVPDSALIYAEKYVSMDDTVYRQSVRREFQKMHALYNYERNERIVQQKENKLKSTRFLSLIIVLSLIFLIVLIMVIESRKKAKMKIRINTLNASYTESLNNYNHANSQLSTLKKAFETNKALLDTLQTEKNQNTSLICRLEQEVEGYSLQINRKQSEIEKLKQTISGFLNEENVSSALSFDNNILEQPIILELHDIIKSGRRPTDHELEKVKSIAEAYYPDFIPNLRKLYPKISSENIMLCILIKLRFIASELGIIFDLKAQAVSNRRRELYKTMFKKTGGTKEFDHRIRIL